MYCSAMMTMATARRAVTMTRAALSAITAGRRSAGVWSMDKAAEGDVMDAHYIDKRKPYKHISPTLTTTVCPVYHLAVKIAS